MSYSQTKTKAPPVLTIVKQNGEVSWGMSADTPSKDRMVLAIQVFSFILPRNGRWTGTQFAQAIEDHHTPKPLPETIVPGTTLPLTPPVMSIQVHLMVQALRLYEIGS